jgi:thiamine biosynthesis lipoprotein
MIKKIILITIIIVSTIIFYRNKQLSYTYDYFYLDTVNSITIYYQNKDHIDPIEIDNGIETILKSMEDTFSIYQTDSMISTLNQEKTIQMNEDFKTLIEKSLYYCNQSMQKYDPTIYPITNLWSINNDNYYPTNAEINQQLTTVDCNNIIIEDNTITLINEATIDLGSIVKGYSADLIVNYLTTQGIDQAIINLGGNVSTMNPKNGTNGYTVGIANPLIDQSGTVATIQVSNKAVVTSGINQRYFIKDNQVYHHLIDANTGYPVENNLASVTIIADQGIDADALSTMVFLMGLEQGYEYIETLQGVDAIFITKDKKIYSTSDTLNLQITDQSFTLNQL